MASDRQIAANRLNALKGTGPKTRGGKAASSQNALKTGLHAKSEVIATESREEYEALIAEYYERYQPCVPEERCLVDNLITAEWLGRRYMAATTAIWEFDFRALKEPDSGPDEHDMGLTFIRRSEALGRAQRCITATQRNYAQTLKQLHSLQANRTSDSPETEETEPLHPQLVSFFPQPRRARDWPLRKTRPI